MNYLAHLYLADITKTSLIGNFLGDFVIQSYRTTDEYNQDDIDILSFIGNE